MKRVCVTRLAAAAVSCCLIFAGSAQSAPIEYRYDALGRVVSVIYPGGQTITYAYDAAGNRTTHVVQATTGNRHPIAVDDSKTWLDGVGTFNFDPRTNDSDPESQAITVVGVGTPQWGSTTFTSTSVGYVAPNAHIVEKDAFSYTIEDTAGGRSSAVVTVDLGNLPPVAANDTVTTQPNTPVTFDPRANDSDPGSDPLTVTATSTPAHGSAAFTGSSVTYTPTASYTGSDSFTYTINDGDGGTANGTVNVTVQGPNNPPVAVNNFVGAIVGIQKNFNPCTNDSDPDGDALTITGASQPSRGTRGWTGCAMWYKVTTGGPGSTSFTYTISDGRGGTATATINVEIETMQ